MFAIDEGTLESLLALTYFKQERHEDALRMAGLALRLNPGDVFARAYVRWIEIQRSVEFVRSALAMLPDGDARVELARPRPDHICVALVEGWRGEVCHVAITDDRGAFSTYKVVDPSFHNWIGLAMALRDHKLDIGNGGDDIRFVPNAGGGIALTIADARLSWLAIAGSAILRAWMGVFQLGR